MDEKSEREEPKSDVEQPETQVTHVRVSSPHAIVL